MENSGAMIPLYLNTDIINNLYTIVIYKFTEIESVTKKNQQVIKINTPLSNVTCGQYIQGNFTVELLNERVRQRIEISKKVVILLELKDLLLQNNLMRDVQDKNSFENMKKNDFVEFTCTLKKNPTISYVESIVNAIEAELIFSPLNATDENKAELDRKREVLKFLKKSIDEYTSSRCFNFVADDINNTNKKILVPLELNFLEDNLDYINNSRVTVLGKVINKDFNYNFRGSSKFCEGSCFDYLRKLNMNDLKTNLLKDSSLIKNSINNQNDEFLAEVLPIAIYI